MATITVNGERRDVQAPGDTPLLYVLRNDLQLTGPQFGCGVAQCGACSVLIDGKEVRSCITALSDVGSKPGDHHARRFACAVGEAKGYSRRGSTKHASPSAASLD